MRLLDERGFHRDLIPKAFRKSPLAVIAPSGSALCIKSPARRKRVASPSSSLPDTTQRSSATPTEVTMSDASPTVAVIGAGIAGPVLAIFLKLKGYAPTLYERTDSVADAGLSLW